MCVCELFACVCTRGASVYGLIRRTFVVFPHVYFSFASFDFMVIIYVVSMRAVN